MITNIIRGHSGSTPNKSPVSSGIFICSHSPSDLAAAKGPPLLFRGFYSHPWDPSHPSQVVRLFWGIGLLEILGIGVWTNAFIRVFPKCSAHFPPVFPRFSASR